MHLYNSLPYAHSSGDLCACAYEKKKHSDLHYGLLPSKKAKLRLRYTDDLNVERGLLFRKLIINILNIKMHKYPMPCKEAGKN